MQLSEHIPHPVSMKTFRRMQEAQAKGKASHQVPASCLFVCDHRAEFALCRNSTCSFPLLTSVQSESYSKSGASWDSAASRAQTKCASSLLSCSPEATSRSSLTDAPPMQRSNEHSFPQPSRSAPGFTLMLTIGLDGQKLAPMLIGQSRREVKHNIPTSAQIRDELKSFGLSLPEIPATLPRPGTTARST